MTLTITGLFTDDSGNFLNALSPTISIYSTASVPLVTNAAMTLIVDGMYGYTYNFANDIQYVWTINGGVSLPLTRRFINGTFKIASVDQQDIRNALTIAPTTVPVSGSIDTILNGLTNTLDTVHEIVELSQDTLRTIETSILNIANTIVPLSLFTDKMTQILTLLSQISTTSIENTSLVTSLSSLLTSKSEYIVSTLSTLIVSPTVQNDLKLKTILDDLESIRKILDTILKSSATVRRHI